MTDTQQENLHLLENALAQTLHTPSSSLGWHKMVFLLRQLANPQVSLQIEQIILSKVPQFGYAGFLRAGFLDILTGRPEYLIQAAKALLGLPEFDPDRAIIFLQSSWQRVLIDIPDRTSFYARLSAIALPEIAGRLHQNTIKNLLASTEIKLPIRDIKTIRKVALIAPLLSNLKHPPTLMALQQARCLRQCGYEVNLYSAQEMLGPNSQQYLGNGIVHQAPIFTLQGWENYLDEDNQVVTGNTQHLICKRWQGLARHIAQFDPDLVMQVGLYSGLSALMYQQRPVLSLGVNSLAPITPSDVWLTAQEELHESTLTPWGSATDSGIAFYYPYRLERPSSLKALPIQNAMSTVNSNWTSDHIVLSTFVSEAEARISGVWARGMCHALKYFPKLRWLIVGGSGQLPSSLQDVSEQVQCLPFCEDVLKYLSCTDIYVNPPMMGGGFSVAEAMAAGVPAISMRDTDGGDKLGSDAVSDLRAYFDLLQRLIQDSQYRETLGIQQEQHFNQILDLTHATPSLQRACELALVRFNFQK
ncbi:glycosyltransferase [Undibacterium baiyunense]|uniref:Glycosyltransferase n=1 Tax=Undibacterium baiyunense TaxID=2828731 RepID=A0A941DGI1_9BURK|nr:glycosyltransferase [Undibacterium baiyunense]MBR7747541.1 glycosyltransferase [Undibacterium baiyunense]